MKKNKLKLLSYWKEDKILTYHNSMVSGSFKVNNINNISLKFINSCWIKKWESLEDLKINFDDTIIAISIGGYFINYLTHSSILKENTEMQLLNNLDNVSKIFYLHLYIILLNLIYLLKNVNSNIISNS